MSIEIGAHEFYIFGDTKEIRFSNLRKLWDKGMAAFKAKEYNSAIKYLYRIGRLFPKKEMSKKSWSDIYVYIGFCFYYKKDYYSALDYYNKAIAFKDTKKIRNYIIDTEYRIDMMALLGVLGGASLINDRVRRSDGTVGLR